MFLHPGLEEIKKEDYDHDNQDAVLGLSQYSKHFIYSVPLNPFKALWTIFMCRTDNYIYTLKKTYVSSLRFTVLFCSGLLPVKKSLSNGAQRQTHVSNTSIV